MQETTTTTELAPVQVGKKKNKFLVVSKTGKTFTRNSFRNYTFACVHVNSGKCGYEEGSEFATWHSTLKNAKPASHLIPLIKEWYAVEIKP
jgi:tRNA U38,U39,U40 pseudouridine synthase TruA